MAIKGIKKAVKDVDHAVPVLGKKPQATDSQKVITTRSTIETMKASPPWAVSPELQSAVAIWSLDTDALDENRTLVSSYREKLRAAEGKQRVFRRKWRGSCRHVLSAAQVICDGSAEVVKELGLEVRTQAPRAPLPIVEGLETASGNAPGEAVVTWRRGRARHGFLVQTATDVSTPSTFGAPLPVSKAKFTLTGATPRSVVHFRVAAIDAAVPAGQTPWSPWVSATVK